jgi:hypothetical protein
MSGPKSLLVVTAAPDDRDSTRALIEMVATLRRRGVRVSVWYLRRADNEPVDDSKVVDDLRTWAPAARLDAIGSRAMGDRLRGLALRRWFRGAAPDAVLLDDGLGMRVLPLRARRVRRVIRVNPRMPADASYEPPPTSQAQLALVHPTLDPNSVGVPTTVPDTGIRDLTRARAAGTPRSVGRARSVLGIPTAVPLIAGWGSDSWLDGPNLFVRMLWSLEHRCGVAAHGVWFGLSDPEDQRQHFDEASRCGLSTRFHLRPEGPMELKLCADAVFLPRRRSSGRIDVLDAVASGLGVVEFHAEGFDDPAVTSIPPFDLDGAAEAVAAHLGTDRDMWRHRARIRLAELDISQQADHLSGLLFGSD